MTTWYTASGIPPTRDPREASPCVDDAGSVSELAVRHLFSFDPEYDRNGEINRYGTAILLTGPPARHP